MAEFIGSESSALESTTVKIYRTAAVAKGGRRFSFGALVVVGDRNGNVGVGYGKAPGVPAAIEKAQKDARKGMIHVKLHDGTLPHAVHSKFGASQVRLIPAAPGTGVIAGATARSVLELAGVHDCLTKAFGSTNHKNLLKATFEGLKKLETKREIEERRGVELGKTETEIRIEMGQRYAPKVDPSVQRAEAPKSLVTKGGRKGGPKRGKQPRQETTPTEAPDAPEASASDATAEPAAPEAPQVSSQDDNQSETKSE